jgi:hypothetical protein
MGGGDRRRPAARILTEPAGLCAENTRRLPAVVARADCQPRGVRRAGGRRPGRVDTSAWLVDRPGRRQLQRGRLLSVPARTVPGAKRWLPGSRPRPRTGQRLTLQRDFVILMFGLLDSQLASSSPCAPLAVEPGEETRPPCGAAEHRRFTRLCDYCIGEVSVPSRRLDGVSILSAGSEPVWSGLPVPAPTSRKKGPGSQLLIDCSQWPAGGMLRLTRNRLSGSYAALARWSRR